VRKRLSVCLLLTRVRRWLRIAAAMLQTEELPTVIALLHGVEMVARGTAVPRDG
jgi:hypothetical protein